MEAKRQNSTIYIEYLTLSSLLFASIQQKQYDAIFYLNESHAGRTCRKILNWFQILTAEKVVRLDYSNLPGSFFAAQEEMYFRSNDAFFSAYSKDNIYVKIATAFTGDERSTIAIEKELLNRYVSTRTKAYTFLKILLTQHDNVTFIPRDRVEIEYFFSSEQKIQSGYSTPRIFRILNNLKSDALTTINFCLLPLFLIGIAVKLSMRGITCQKPSRVRYAVGFDVQGVGLKKDRGLIDGTFFLYDDDDFKPSEILHVIRTHLEDENAALSLKKFDCPYIEFDSIKIPARYFASRIIRDLLIKCLAVTLKNLLCCNKEPAFLLPALATVKMTAEAEIFYQYFDIPVFIARDEYSPFHIVRTLVANRHGNKTVAFQWADYWDRGEALSHFVFDAYGVWGDFYRAYLTKTLKQTKATHLVGCNMYGSDWMSQVIKRGDYPEAYRDLQREYVLVAVMGSSIAPEILLTKENTLKFYRDTLDIVNRYDNAYCVLKPKMGDLDEELEQLVQQYPRSSIERALHTYAFLPAVDVVICIGNSTIGLEALMAGKKVIYYDVTQYKDHLYAGYSPYLVAFDRAELERNIHRILGEGQYIDDKTLKIVKEKHGFAFDGDIIGRFKNICRDLIKETNKQIIK